MAARRPWSVSTAGWMPRASSRSSSSASMSSRLRPRGSVPSRNRAATVERAMRRSSESDTSRCWAPSCRLRSSRRRSASPAATMRARDAASSDRASALARHSATTSANWSTDCSASAASFAAPIVETVIAPHRRPSAVIGAATVEAQSERAQPLGQLALDLAVVVDARGPAGLDHQADRGRPVERHPFAQGHRDDVVLDSRRRRPCRPSTPRRSARGSRSGRRAAAPPPRSRRGRSARAAPLRRPSSPADAARPPDGRCGRGRSRPRRCSSSRTRRRRRRGRRCCSTRPCARLRSG